MQLIRDGRDIRVDFFRGLALWWIFTDHIPGNWLGYVSLHDFSLADATEVFVLLAGYGAGMAYGRAMDRTGVLHATADVLRRAWTLYIAHIVLFVIFSAQVSYSATALDRIDYLEEVHLDVLADAPYRALLEFLMLRFQPAFLDILPLYIVLLLMFAPALPLLRRPRLLMALSIALYAAVRIFDLNLPSWTGGTWFFDPLAWQVLLIAGAILAYAPPRMPPHRRVIDVVAVVVVLLSWFTTFALLRRPDLFAMLPSWYGRAALEVDKTGLHPARIASIAALAWLVVRLVPPDAAWLRRRFAAPLVLIGQHSLPVFCFSIFASFLGRLAMETRGGAFTQFGVNVTGAFALVGIGALAAWYREKGRAASRPSGVTE
jgi:hypothetical protein